MISALFKDVDAQRGEDGGQIERVDGRGLRRPARLAREAAYDDEMEEQRRRSGRRR